MNKYKRLLFSLLLVGTSIFVFLFSTTSETNASGPKLDGMTVNQLIQRTLDFVQSMEMPAESGKDEVDMTLAGTEWQFSWGQVDGESFSPFANQPVTLNFDADRIFGNGFCNNFFGSYTIDGDNLTIGAIGATRKLCEPELMDLETQFFNALQSTSGFTYNADSLTLSLPNGELHFRANMTVEKTIFIAAEQVDCQAGAGGPRKCLLMREDPNAEWETFYDQIAGFEWQEGTEYELRVRVIPVENPPADASSVRYELIEIVNQSSIR